MSYLKKLKENLTFGFEQTLTIPNWWADEGFTATSDTPKKREMMLALAEEIANQLNGSFKESLDIWDHMQYETFDKNGKPSFIVTMDPGSIEVKTEPCLEKDIIKMITPLFIASERVGLVPYRNWWYGIKGGTEGGCHVNMGGFTPETNPLKQDPSLVVKYSAYIHNRPFLHYPFMGLDVGPEGNAMRMDEKEGFDLVSKAFQTYTESMNPDQTYKHFENTNLINNKSSYPSLFKFKAPLFLIEDRGQEAMREPEDFKIIVDLRLKIFEVLSNSSLEELRVFDKSLHQEKLTSHSLWEDFHDWAIKNSLKPQDFKCFFNRQFPILSAGGNPPQTFGFKEGRRPRIVKDIVKKGDTVISKTIDTSYKRFELFTYTPNESNVSFEIDYKLEKESELLKCNAPLGLNGEGIASYKYIDLKVDQTFPILKIKTTIDNKTEEVFFNLNDMMWS